MSGDGRIDVSPDGKRLLLSIDTGEESGRKDWDGTVARALGVRSPISKGDQADAKKNCLVGMGVWIDNDNILFLSRAVGEKDDSIYRMSTSGKNLKRLIKNGRFPSVSAP
jgi:TolB protein